MKRKRTVFLPKWREFPFKPLSDVQGSSLKSSSLNSISLRSIPRSILIQDLHNIIDASQSSSSTISRSTSSHNQSSHSYHSIGGGSGVEEEAAGSSLEEEDIDGGNNGEGDDSHDTHDEGDEESDDHQEDDEKGQHVTSASSLNRKSIKEKSIYEELRERSVSPKQRNKSRNIPVSPICGAPQRRSGKQSMCRDTVKAPKKKPVVSITVNTPLMSDLAKHSSPSKNISIMLPYRSAED